jgi:predicted RNA-binding Zn-ribbon protein involved in translation (DUF1610 family)
LMFLIQSNEKTKQSIFCHRDFSFWLKLTSSDWIIDFVCPKCGWKFSWKTATLN